MAKFGIGQSVRRVEDPRLLTGGGRYTDDTKLSAPAARAYVLRSPHAHADIKSIDTAAARKAPGSIINVTSVAGIRAAPLQGVYGMTKAGVMHLTKTAAAEFGRDFIGERQALHLRSICAEAERRVPEWPATTPSCRSLLRRAVRFLAKQGIIIEVKKGHWKLRGAK